MRSIQLQARPVVGPFQSRRLLAVVGDQRLVAQIRQGNDAAFEVVYERHGPGILAFCRHMLGSREDAEDAVQYSFAAAYRDLLRDEREIDLKPWLYRIARNRCISVLRARREAPSDTIELSTAGLAEKVERRVELRQLLADLLELPSDQREALLLTEVGGLSHLEVSGVLGCEAAQVKTLVFSARSKLIERRQAREVPCEEIREQLATLRGGALRRSHLRHHLHGCHACRTYKDEVQRQRRMLASALPAVPSAGLKAGVLGAVGLGQGSAGGGAALIALGGGGAASLGGATLAKVALVGVLGASGVSADRAVGGERRAHAPGPPIVATQPPATVQQARSQSVPKPVSAAEPRVRLSPDRRAPLGQLAAEPDAPSQQGTAPPSEPREQDAAAAQPPGESAPSATRPPEAGEWGPDPEPPAHSNPQDEAHAPQGQAHAPAHAQAPSPPAQGHAGPPGNSKPDGLSQPPERPARSQEGGGPPVDPGAQGMGRGSADAHGNGAAHRP